LYAYEVIVLRFLITTVVLLGSAHAQTPPPWIGNATNGAPQPSPEEQVCSMEMKRVTLEIRKHEEEIRAASEQHAPFGALCKAYGRLTDAKNKLITVQTKLGCIKPPSAFDDILTSHFNTQRVKERVCSTPETRMMLGLDNTLVDPSPSKNKMIGDFRVNGRW
jgi:hypothetical protein